MTDTQGLTSPNDIPRGAVDAAARALGNHINVDFDLLGPVEQLEARETTLAALNAATPLIVAAELDRQARTIDVTAPLGDLIATAEAAARRQVRDTLLDRVAELKSGVDEPAKPRTWRAGDPEPEDFPTVASPSGANEFAHREGGWFHTSGCTCCVDIPWDELVRQCGPLSEVTSTEAAAS